MRLLMLWKIGFFAITMVVRVRRFGENIHPQILSYVKI